MSDNRRDIATVHAVEDPGTVLELAARVAVQRRILDSQYSAPGVDDEEDGAATFTSAVTADDGAVDQQVVLITVGVDCTAAAAARRA